MTDTDREALAKLINATVGERGNATFADSVLATADTILAAGFTRPAEPQEVVAWGVVDNTNRLWLGGVDDCAIYRAEDGARTRAEDINVDGELVAEFGADDDERRLHGFGIPAERPYRAVALYINPPVDRSPARPEVDTAQKKLADFGLAVIEATREELGDLDGGELQEMAVMAGVLAPVHATEPCAEECRCAEYDDFPQECFRYPPDVRAAIDAARAPRSEQEERPDAR